MRDSSVYSAAQKSKMSKRGSSQVRAAFHMVVVNSVAVAAQKNHPAGNPILVAYYGGKCKSKPGKVAMCAVMRKISNIVFAVLSGQQPLELCQPQEYIQQLELVSKE